MAVVCALKLYNKRRLTADGTAAPFRHPLASLASADLSAHTKLNRVNKPFNQAKLATKPITQHSLPRRKRRGENGLCADPLAKSRFYRLAAVPLFIFCTAKHSAVFRGEKYIICGIYGGQFYFCRCLKKRYLRHIYGSTHKFEKRQ